MDIKEKLGTYTRVLRLARKPDSKEYQQVAKVTGLGIVVIGAVGFLIKLVSQLITRFYG
ncbi:MAG: protein translocase SEC61 complex subunit gamma [Theionarchaea archaeon]|nr:protein translocase SEC61 complex subunit gamma [Theionarchaea archaeon]MBU7000248.1 protein translocase SEC61 complex subunit gamma [Theionarchaea archaeon]MBU7022049.1 protein translocase SEC61 complex subunit gamma [Theionarchaea archaeon]MBU7034731.1 protein translocase SEC61 complex subunit gamma [Theionarchaea archaeon]MBU7041655.1 protein translocase SEC61 complex subunit gamma [Theionarchaea archaeon]